MRRFMFLLLCLNFCLVACNDEQNNITQPPAELPFSFAHQGLPGITVNRIYHQHQLLFAATDDGLYINHGDGNWLTAGLKGYDLYDVVAISEQHFIASTYVQDIEGFRQYRLLETYDAGAQWQEIKHGFGAHGETDAIHALAYFPAQQHLYATGTEALAYSDDYGISWQLVFGFWQGFGQPKSALAYNAEHNEMWFGGQGAIENPVLYRVPLDQPDEFDDIPDLFPSPSVVYGIRFAPDNADTVYITGEGGIVSSTDNGQNWTSLLGDVNYRFYYDIAIDNDSPQRLFTAGWDKKFDDPQPLILEWSSDSGASWQRYTYPAPDDFFGGVRSMTLVTQGQQRVWYLGLWKGGIMQVTLN